MSMSYPARTAFFWWSREAPPYHLAVAGLRHPLREPYVPLSKYTALSLFVQHNSLIMNQVVTSDAHHQRFPAFGQHCDFPGFFSFEVFQFVDVVDFVMFAFRRAA